MTSSSSSLTPDEIVRVLGMTPIPIEGGRLGQTLHDDFSSAITYLITPDDFSGLHSLPHVEVWSFHTGAPVSLLLLHPDGRVDEPVLGVDLAAGQRPQIVVEPGVVMGAEPLGEWSLVGTYMAPRYEENQVIFPEAEALAPRYPLVAERIRRMARR